MMRLRTSIGVSATLPLVCALVTGCVHQEKPAAVTQQAKTPNIYVPPPAPEDLPPMEAQPPAHVTEAKPAVAEEVKPKKKSKRSSAASQPASTATATPAAVAPIQPAPPQAEAPAPPDAAKLGALDSGGDASSGQQREVADKISVVEKRLSDIPAPVQDKEQKQLAKVRLFNKEASDALKSGDVDGARILATKAELLLDDLTTK